MNRFMSITKIDVEQNKFYVGSNSIFTRNGVHPERLGWGHSTVEEAVQQATELAREKECDMFVVQIVRVVRIAKPPVDVEVVE